MNMKFNGYKMSCKFNAKHSMNNKEEDAHSHTFRVTVYIEKQDSSFAEFNEYENKVKEYLGQFKKQYLNNMKQFKNKLPTLENMCQVFYKDIWHIFFDTNVFNLVKLEVSDSPIKTVALSDIVITGNSDTIIDIELIEKLFNSLEDKDG